jgi:hypothetical protein
MIGKRLDDVIQPAQTTATGGQPDGDEAKLYASAAVTDEAIYNRVPIYCSRNGSRCQPVGMIFDTNVRSL